MLLVVCGLKRYVLSLNQSYIFCKTKANSVIAKENTVATMIQYDISRLRAVTYNEKLPINLLYISRSEQRYYSEVNDTA